MRMPHEANLVEALKDAHELAGIGVNVIRKNVLVDRPPRRGVHAQHLPLLEADGQVAEELPALSAPHRIGISLETISRPETGLLRPAIEVEWFVENGEIVVAHQRNPAALGDD